MLKQMISEFVYSSRYLLVHKALTMCNQFNFNDFDEDSNMKKLSKKLQHENEVTLPLGTNLVTIDKPVYLHGIKPAVIDYIDKKRKWFKAFEIIVEIVTRANDENLANTKERNIFRHQFILNYLNATDENNKETDRRAKIALINDLICGLRIGDGN